MLIIFAHHPLSDWSIDERRGRFISFKPMINIDSHLGKKAPTIMILDSLFSIIISISIFGNKLCKYYVCYKVLKISITKIYNRIRIY